MGDKLSCGQAQGSHTHRHTYTYTDTHTHRSNDNTRRVKCILQQSCICLIPKCFHWPHGKLHPLKVILNHRNHFLQTVHKAMKHDSYLEDMYRMFLIQTEFVQQVTTEQHSNVPCKTFYKPLWAFDCLVKQSCLPRIGIPIIQLRWYQDHHY